MLGTRLLDRYTRRQVLLPMLLTAGVGSLLVVFAPPALAYIGTLMWGFGVSLGFPVGLSAAADDPRRAAARMSVVATVGYGAFIAGPAMPGDPRRLPLHRRHTFHHPGRHGKPEGAEEEAVTQSQLRPLAVMDFDVGSIVVVGRPQGGLGEQRPYVCGGQAAHDHFVRDKVVGEAWHIAGGPLNV